MSARDQQTIDRTWMEQALALAALGEGATSPNPRVGCVIVRNGSVVGSGHHRVVGSEHAEAVAIRRAGEAARGATLYVSLEPCKHHGRTPPCCDRILESGIRRVVAAVQDPNPRVDGGGFRRLREAGLVVVTGILEKEARELNLPFFKWFATGRPTVSLKAAVTADGRIAAQRGESKWITGDPARRFSHRLRFAHDAVLVGANTVRTDDPRLNVRLHGLPSGSKLRVVIAPGLDLHPDARLFHHHDPEWTPPRIYVSEDLPAEKAGRFVGLADIIRVPGTDGRIEIDTVLEDLGRIGIQSVMVEGGARTLAGFLEAGAADRAFLFSAPLLLGDRGGTPMLDMPAVPAPSEAWKLEGIRRISLGRDTLTWGRLSGPGSV